ncbi:MAG: toll/interleukin-1 receptor domain-containing protein [Hyphomicrobium sp.]
MAVLFFSYSHRDENLRDKLEVHLAMLKRQGVIETWHDRRFVAGDEFAGRIGQEIERADIILLLVSPDFLASDYCYDIEMTRAIERHQTGEARVIPVVLRPCDWHAAPFGKLNAVPRDGKPVTTWPDLDEAFLDIVMAIKNSVAARPAPSRAPAAASYAPNDNPALPLPRSSNLRVKKEFTDVDKDRHLDEAFEFMVRFFEGSLQELGRRNASLQTTFRRIDADSFTGTIYRDGKNIAECRIARGGFVGDGITYSSNARRQGNGINESLSVEADGQGMYLRAIMSMHRMAASEDPKLTFEGAAEYYWSMLVDRLQ